MKKFRIGMVALVATAGMAAAQTNTAAFFRISSPTNAVITEFDAGTGTISWSNGVEGVTNQLQRSVDLVETNGWVDFAMLVSTGTTACAERIIDLDPPEGMAWIPGGSFRMGDSKGDGYSDELPVHSVYVDGFYMDRTEVTKAQWDSVHIWAVANGYDFDNPGSGKAPIHPVHTVSWYDCVKWCNARSEMEGRTPCYTVSGSPYKTGQSAPYCNFEANGYRLPTDAEWEYAARGGLSGKRFPWGDTITHSQANYHSDSSYNYDASSTRGYHPDYDDGTKPYTSPVGSFGANGYGLYDMSGNVWEWCNDASDAGYSFRGGGWLSYAGTALCGYGSWHTPDDADSCIGFRSVCRSKEEVPIPNEEVPIPNEVRTVDLGGGVTMEFMPIPAGSFMMGSDNLFDDRMPVHQVTLSKSFWMAKTEVTQAQWKQIMGSNPSEFMGDDLPVEQVSWNDAASFCTKLTEIERQAGRLPKGYAYTLPTEAQWEYAYRAGTTVDYEGDLDAMGWYEDNSRYETHPVGTKQANAWGLYDMHGNVWEWCSDWYGDYPSGNVVDPSGPPSGSRRVFRGDGVMRSGEWYVFGDYRLASRGRYDPSNRYDFLGFRVCLSAR